MPKTSDTGGAQELQARTGGHILYIYCTFV
jgi:hypothetical protein